ncbi:Transcriptional regulator OS=Streptomyces microflavus OX=1919 GN=Smic_42020 PE=4 SV=1 [Streptomyces microflavus]
MELEQRVAELERRLTALERQDRESPRLGDGDFWALNGLKQQLADVGEAAADGGVLFTGAPRPTSWRPAR